MTASVVTAVLVILGFVLPVVARGLSRRYVPMGALLLVAGVLNSISTLNVHDGPLPGAQWDAESFHEESAKLAEDKEWPVLSIGTEVYKYILTGTYRLLGDRVAAGQALSILASVGSLLMVVLICRVMGIDGNRVVAWLVVVLCGLYPTFVYHGALTFREPFEILGFTLGTYGFLRMWRDRRLRWLFTAAAGYLLMSLFHHVLMGIALALVIWGVLCVFASGGREDGTALRRNALVATTIVAVTVVSGYLVVTLVPATSRNDYVADIRDADGALDAIVKYRQEVESRDPRTSFDPGIDADRPVEAVKGLAANYASYMFKPYATDIEYRMDLVPFAGSLGRLLLIGVVLAWLVYRRTMNGGVAFLLGAYLITTGVWSLGTTNYGQAFRHHAMTDWMLVLLCGYVVIRELARRAVGVETAKLE